MSEAIRSEQFFRASVFMDVESRLESRLFPDSLTNLTTLQGQLLWNKALTASHDVTDFLGSSALILTHTLKRLHQKHLAWWKVAPFMLLIFHVYSLRRIFEGHEKEVRRKKKSATTLWMHRNHLSTWNTTHTFFLAPATAASPARQPARCLNSGRWGGANGSEQQV